MSSAKCPSFPQPLLTSHSVVSCPFPSSLSTSSTPIAVDSPRALRHFVANAISFSPRDEPRLLTCEAVLIRNVPAFSDLRLTHDSTLRSCVGDGARRALRPETRQNEFLEIGDFPGRDRPLRGSCTEDKECLLRSCSQIGRASC